MGVTAISQIGYQCFLACFCHHTVGNVDVSLKFIYFLNLVIFLLFVLDNIIKLLSLFLLFFPVYRRLVIAFSQLFVLRIDNSRQRLWTIFNYALSLFALANDMYP